MAHPMAVDLPNGESIEVNDSEWMEIASEKWNRVEDNGHVEWIQSVRRHGDGRILVYVIYLPTSGILQTAGEILPARSDDVSHLITRLAQRFDVPTNVPHACSEQYERYARQLKR